MAGFNRVILMGRLTRDPELRFTNTQTAICTFGLAMSRRFKKNDEWVEEPTFVDCTIMGPRAEPFSRYFTKGKTAHVEGHLRFETWDDKQTGAKRSKLVVFVENWEFCGEKERAAEEPLPEGQRSMNTVAKDEAPW